jgi:sodium/bile acid cotransporter 7
MNTTAIRFKPDYFLLAMLGAVVLAVLYPALGAGDGPLQLAMVTQLGIALVFFLHGANLSRASLHSGLQNWRLHLFVQLATYALFPLIGFVVVGLGRGLMPFDLLLGFFYLCALSSTISSSVALTAMAKGNVPASIFNATLSGLLGMFITPLLVGVVVATSGESIAVGAAILDILLTLLLPFALGHGLRPLLMTWLARHKSAVGRLDRAVIVLIVYAAFCESTAAGVWSKYGFGMIALVIALTGVLLLAVVGLTTAASRRLGFSVEDEITAVFCGSKKSLANGVPIANVLFVGHPALGIIVLPLMIYHQLQLLLCTWLARRYAARTRAGSDVTI